MASEEEIEAATENSRLDSEEEEDSEEAAAMLEAKEEIISQKTAATSQEVVSEGALEDVIITINLFLFILLI